MKKIISLAASLACCSVLALADQHHENTYELPKLQMKDTKLSFDEIAGYEDYKIVATHFRKDKNEIRYILANDVAFDALKNKKEKTVERDIEGAEGFCCAGDQLGGEVEGGNCKNEALQGPVFQMVPFGRTGLGLLPIYLSGVEGVEAKEVDDFTG